MKLPNAENGVVEREKIVAYLLSPSHPDSGGKASFFQALGFNSDEWQILAATLRKLAETSEVAKKVESLHGRKYIVVGRIRTPCGRTPVARSIWIVDRGQRTPRLVTAYPEEE